MEDKNPTPLAIAPPPSPPPLPSQRWYERLNVLNVSFLLFLLAVLNSSNVLRGSGRDLDYSANVKRVFSNFFPPDVSVAGEALRGLGETFKIAVMATFLAIFLAVPLAVAGAQTMSPRWLTISARLIMNCIRTPPSLIWAVVAVAIVGANTLAGVIALTFYSVGYLGKFFSDTFESVDIEIARGLRATGAGTLQAFQHGVWPYAKPFVWSHSLWMLEYNIRSAAIVGYVGAGGVGVLLHSYAEYYAWQKFATVLLMILVVVTLLDLLGEWIRKKMTRPASKPLARR